MRKGWEIKKLGQVCSKVTDGSHNPPKGVDNSEFLMLSSKNIFDDLIHYDSPRFLTKNDFINENKRTEVQYNDVLLTVVGTIGRVAVVPINHKKITLQRSVAVLRVREELLNSRFLMFSLQNILEFLTNEARGVAQKGIYLNQLKEIQIPLPPLPEQQRIVSILDEAFSSIEQAKENLQRNLQNAKELFQSEMNSIFTNKGEGWEEKTLNQISLNLDNKRVPITKNVRSSGEYPYYGASGIVDYVGDFIFDDDLLLVSEDGANLLARTYPGMVPKIVTLFCIKKAENGKSKKS